MLFPTLNDYLNGLCCKKKVRIINQNRESVLTGNLTDENGAITIEELDELKRQGKFEALFNMEIAVPYHCRINDLDHVIIMVIPR